MFALVCFIAVLAVTQVEVSAGGCTENKTFLKFVRLSNKKESGPKQCQISCGNTEGCTFWNFDSKTKGCSLQGIRSVKMKAAISGKKNCDMLTCRSSTEAIEDCIKYKKYLKPIRVAKLKKVASKKKCEDSCKESQVCSFWTYWPKKKTCVLRGMKSVSIKTKSSGRMACKGLCGAISYLALPEICKEQPYEELTHATRKAVSGVTSTPYAEMFYDDLSSDRMSPDWKGNVTYRVTGAAGSRLAMLSDFTDDEYLPSCGTEYSNFVKDDYLSLPVGQSIDTMTCYNLMGRPTCWDSVEIQVLNCGEYFLFKLGDLKWEDERYCTV